MSRFDDTVTRWYSAMARPDLPARVKRSGLDRYLLAGEIPVVAQRQHVAKISKPVLLFVAGSILVLVLDTVLPIGSRSVVPLLWSAWLVLFGWTFYHWLTWRGNWLVATDKRMLVNYGLINVNVAILSLSKVVDLSYVRSPWGYLLGYGTFLRESSGSSQTLHKVEYVKRPDQTFRIICGAIFGLDAPDTAPGEDDQILPGDQLLAGGPVLAKSVEPLLDPDPYAGFVIAGDPAAPSNPSRRIHTRPAEPDDSDSWHPDPTMSEPDIHDADTGPIS